MCRVTRRVPILSTGFLIALTVFVGETVRAQQACKVTLAPRISRAPNIFSAQQERMLGDIEAEWVESSYQKAPDERLAAHLNKIAVRVQAQFPDGPLPIHVILIDTPEAESFSIGPERIYVTRKMVTLLNNDDELAGLLGHELGHIQDNQNAIIITKLFHAILGVNEVSDQKDIRKKLKQMFDSIDSHRKSLKKAGEILERQESVSQEEADYAALYASAAAGFSPQAYVDLFVRSAGTNGKIGSLLTDYFGSSTSDLRRLREIQKTLRQLPRACQEMVPATSMEFRTWQAAVMAKTDTGRR